MKNEMLKGNKMVTCADLANLTDIVASANRGVDLALEMLARCAEDRNFEGIKFWSESLEFWLDVLKTEILRVKGTESPEFWLDSVSSI